MQLSQVTLNGVLMQNEQSWVGKLTTKGTNWFASTTYFVKGELPDKIFMLLHIDEAIIILNQAIEKLPLKLPKKWNPHSVGPPCSTAYVPPEYCFKSINPLPSHMVWTSAKASTIFGHWLPISPSVSPVWTIVQCQLREFHAMRTWVNQESHPPSLQNYSVHFGSLPDDEGKSKIWAECEAHFTLK